MQNQYGSQPSTGATRRIGSGEFGTSGPRVYGEPQDQQI
jgi:hypothetical protein